MMRRSGEDGVIIGARNVAGDDEARFRKGR